MNHIPMDVDTDQDDDWVTGQLKATCNVDQSFFNDWFSGHLNFQIEHQYVLHLLMFCIVKTSMNFQGIV